MTDVLVCLDVGDKDLAKTLCVSAVLSHIHRRLDGSTQLELVAFDGDNANERHLHDEFLRILVVQAVLLNAPSGTLEEQSLNVGTRVEAFGDLRRVSLLGHLSVKE